VTTYPSQTTDSTSTTLRVIVIEDEEGHFQLMRRAITKELPHSQIHYFEAAETCLQHIAEIDPHVVLVDYRIPGMNGLEFLKEVKRINRDIPVIIVTGHGDETIAVQALHLGAADYLVKSGDFFKLVPGVLTKVIEKRKLQASLWKTAQLNDLLLNSLPSPAMLLGRDGTILAANQKAREIGARIGGPCLRELCPVKNLAGPCNPAQNRTSDGGDAPQRVVECSPMKAANQLIEVHAFGSVWEVRSASLGEEKHLLYATDISRRKRAEETLAVMHRFLKIANQYSILGPLLEAFVREIKSHLGCNAVGIRVVDEQGNIPYKHCLGFDQNFCETESPLSINSDQGMCINVVRGEKICSLPFFTPGGSFYTNHTTQSLSGIFEEHRGTTCDVCSQHGFESVAIIPIRLHDRILGLIHVADRLEDKVPLSAVELIERVARQLATAMERANSAEALLCSERQLRLLSSRLLTVQEEERKRIAGELHDSIGSSLCAIKLGLDNSLRNLKPTSPVHIRMKEAATLTQDTLVELRRIMTDLRPAVLDDLGLVTTMEWFCRRFRSTFGTIRINKQLAVNEREIPEPLKIVILRMMQEAFNNIAKHSEAEQVDLIFVRNGSKLELTIRDDGLGFDLTAASADKCDWNAGGLGLTSMKERTELSGGTFLISSSPGKGTSIQACWTCTGT